MPLQGYWWAGRDNATLSEPTPSHANCLTARRACARKAPTTTPALAPGASVAPANFAGDRAGSAPAYVAGVHVAEHPRSIAKGAVLGAVLDFTSYLPFEHSFLQSFYRVLKDVGAPSMPE